MRLIFLNIWIKSPCTKSKVYLRFIIIWNLWSSTKEEKMGFLSAFLFTVVSDRQMPIQHKNACQWVECVTPHKSSKRHNRDVCSLVSHLTMKKLSSLHRHYLYYTWLDPKMLTYWRLTFSELGSCRTLLSQIKYFKS